MGSSTKNFSSLSSSLLLSSMTLSFTLPDVTLISWGSSSVCRTILGGAGRALPGRRPPCGLKY